MAEATKRLEAAHGPGPKKPKKLGRIKAALVRFVVRQFVKGLKFQEVKMSPFVIKIITSLVFGFGAIGLVLNAALADGVISGGEWTTLLSAFAVAAWGKFSSNTRFIAPSRKGETVASPK